MTATSTFLPGTPDDAAHALPGTGRFARVAAVAIAVLVVAVPFEPLVPMLAMPGQSLSMLEVVLLGVLAACGFVAWRMPAWPRVDRAVAASGLALAGGALVSAWTAPAFGGNALHMAGRLVVACAVVAATAGATATSVGRRVVVFALVGSGGVVAALVVADFADVPGVRAALAPFRAGLAVVGAEVRASGPFQYPTIASMYLEVVFAFGVAWLAFTRSPRRAALLFAVLACVSAGVVATLTRSGLVTLGTSLLLVGIARRGDRRTLVRLAAVALIVVVQLVTTRSVEALRLRLTSEGQGRWFSAAIVAPPTVTLDTRTVLEVPLRVTNTGRQTWHPGGSEPTRLSYHWLDAESDAVVAWEGIRTDFAGPVPPGASVSLRARVDAPPRPGAYRLLWDLEQEHRLWFSTEPGATLAMSRAVVTGPATGALPSRGPRRLPGAAERPGRRVLWRAAWDMFLERPLLGVGPDNFRLLYGRYAPVVTADPRVHSNNMYVELAAGTGLVGVLALGALVLAVGRRARAALAGGAVGVGSAAAVAAFGVHGLADSFLSFTGTYALLGVVIGLVATSPARTGGRHAHRV